MLEILLNSKCFFCELTNVCDFFQSLAFVLFGEQKFWNELRYRGGDVLKSKVHHDLEKTIKDIHMIVHRKYVNI